MKIISLCVLSAGLSNAFVMPGPKVHSSTTSLASSMAMDNRMRNPNFRNDDLYGNARGNNQRGYNVSPNQYGDGGGGQFERYDPRRHTKDGKNYDERRFEFDNSRPGGGMDNMNMPRRDFYFDDRDLRQGPFEPRQRMNRSPIVESADGRNMLERYDPNRHRNTGESRFEPSRLPRDYERLRDGPMGFGVAENFSFDQPYDRPGSLIMNRGAANQNRNRSFNSENSGRLITPDTGRMSNRDSDWWNGNPSGTPREREAMRRDRQERRSTAELLKNGGTDMFQTQRRNDRRPDMGIGMGMGMERRPQNPNMMGMERRPANPNMGMERLPQSPGMERRPVNPNAESYGYPGERGDRQRFPLERYERATPGYGREDRSERRWEDPYRVGDRTSLARDTLIGPQRLDGGTRRQWTFEADVASIQLEMWTEGLPLMATVEIFEKGGQKKNSFDVYVEDGYNRPYSSVLDLPHQSGGTILIRNDGPIEYPIVANVQPFSRGAGMMDGMRDEFQDNRNGMRDEFQDNRNGMRDGYQDNRNGMRDGYQDNRRGDGW